MQLAGAPNWSNGRDVGTWAKRTFTAASLRAVGGGSGTEADVATDEDLRAGLKELLADKATTHRPAAASDAAAELWRSLPVATATAQPPTQPPPAAAPPVVVTAPTEMATEPEPQKQAQPPGDFNGLDPGFLSQVQDALTALGYDLSSFDAAAALAGDPNLPASLLPLLLPPGASAADAAQLTERLRQWQAMLAQRMEEEKEAARRSQRPVWRCAVCGRYGCPVAPYIERYEEV
jgi:hypothetical protein